MSLCVGPVISAGGGGGGGNLTPGAGSSGWPEFSIPVGNSSGQLTNTGKLTFDETSSANDTFLRFGPNTNGNRAILTTQGNFATEVLTIVGSNALRLSGSNSLFGDWEISSTGHFNPSVFDNTYDIGQSSLRPRHLLAGGYLELGEMTAPAGTADRARIFAEDDGGGKTRLMVQFPTGGAIQLAIEA